MIQRFIYPVGVNGWLIDTRVDVPTIRSVTIVSESTSLTVRGRRIDEAQTVDDRKFFFSRSNADRAMHLLGIGGSEADLLQVYTEDREDARVDIAFGGLNQVA